MKLGAEPKQVKILIGLLALGGLTYYFSSGDTRPPSDPAPKSAAAPAVTAAPVPGQAVTSYGGARNVSTRAPQRQPAGRTSVQEFKPVLKSRRAEDRVDPTKVDPTLRLDLLARLQSLPIEGGSRPVFDFSAAPAPKAPDPPKIPIGKMIGPMPPPPVTKPAAPAAPVKPQAPPIRFKFYGFTGTGRAVKRAFFLDGDDILVGAEGDLLRKRYRIVRINLNSVVMEDTEFKSQQTLPLEEQLP